ncbi:MAG: hypothetical protein BWX63_02030 [Bacteroidetes bacterium ADurb.Bin041]|nr:MAG: hypothetical protein BWX63_02030 [Bacteroidetes bacterium ADurb.Bin041]
MVVDQEFNTPILPFGLFCSGKTISSSFSGNTGFSLPHTFRKKQIVRDGLTGRSTLRFCPLGFFVPEKRNPRRLVVTLVFRCLIPSGKNKS